MEKHEKIIRLAESALMLAAATILSLIKLINLPYGGSVTACSALPLLLIAYRYGWRRGMLVGTAFGLLTMMLDGAVLSYCPTALSAAAVILLDYLLAFAATGLGGLFRGKPQDKALVLGALVAGLTRYACHVISGCTVWAGLSIPTRQAWLYSLAYNATYMLPELLVTLLGCRCFAALVDISGARPRRAKRTTDAGGIFRTAAVGAAVAAGIADVTLIFAHLQDAATGVFSFAGLRAVPWLTVAVITAAAGLIAGALLLWARRRK